MNSKLNKAYTTFLVFSLILDAYAFNFLPSMSLSYIGLVIFMILFIIRKNKDDKKIVVGPLVLVGLLILESVVNIIISTNQSLFTTKFVITSIKMIVWALSIAYTSKYIIKDRFLNQSVKVATIATIYLLIQAVFFYIMSINLPNGFNFGLIKFIGVDITKFNSAYRPASFFAEPSYFASFAVLVLSIYLFNKRQIKNKKIVILLYLGILLSTSSGGIYLLIILSIIYLLNSANKKITNMVLMIIFVIPLSILVYYNHVAILKNMGSVGKATLTAINKVNNSEKSSRLGGSFKYFENLDGNQKILGYGLGNEYIPLDNKITYLNSITRLYLQSGVIGLTIFFIYIISTVKKIKNPCCLFILIVYLIKCFTAGAMFSIGGYFILTLYYIIDRIENKEQ